MPARRAPEKEIIIMAGSDELLQQQPVQQQRDQFQPEEAITREAFQQEWDARTEAMDPLLNSQRSILGINVKDSAEMAQVKQSLRALNQALDIPLRSAASGDAEKVLDCYDTAIAACKHYITVKDQPRTEQGRARLHMVQQMLPKLKLEQTLFRDETNNMRSHSLRYDPQRGWRQLLHYAHAVQFDAQNDHIQTVDAHGMAALEVTRGGQSVQFLPDVPYQQLTEPQRIAAYLKAHENDADLTAAYNTLKQNIGASTFLLHLPGLLNSMEIRDTYASLTNEQLTDVLEQIRRTPQLLNLLNKLNVSQTLFQQPQFTALCRMSLSLNEQFTTQNYFETANISEGSSLPMRAAAFSRMDTLLGPLGVVPEARISMLKTEDGKTQMGTVQRTAAGESLGALMRRQQLHPDDFPPLIYSDFVINQLLNIQLLNLICGKTNHNFDDCIVHAEVQEGHTVVTDLVSTHNEISFGKLRFEDIQSDLPQNLWIMDDAVYHAIQSHSPETLTAMFRDLLSAEELDALIDRFMGIKEYLNKRKQGLDMDGNQLDRALQFFSDADSSRDWHVLFVADQVDKTHQKRTTLIDPKYIDPKYHQVLQYYRDHDMPF